MVPCLCLSHVSDIWNYLFFFAVGTFKIHGEDIQTSLDAALYAGYRAIGKSTGEGWCYAKRSIKTQSL